MAVKARKKGAVGELCRIATDRRQGLNFSLCSLNVLHEQTCEYTRRVRSEDAPLLDMRSRVHQRVGWEPDLQEMQIVKRMEDCRQHVAVPPGVDLAQ